jgi:hypothetical protein
LDVIEDELMPTAKPIMKKRTPAMPLVKSAWANLRSVENTGTTFIMIIVLYADTIQKMARIIQRRMLMMRWMLDQAGNVTRKRRRRRRSRANRI